MVNKVILVGRIANEPIIEELESGRKVSKITLAVERPYNNTKGEYQKDFVPVVLYGCVAESTFEYCKKGDCIAVYGRIQSIEMASGSVIEIVADRVTFLTSSRKDEE